MIRIDLESLEVRTREIRLAFGAAAIDAGVLALRVAAAFLALAARRSA